MVKYINTTIHLEIRFLETQVSSWQTYYGLSSQISSVICLYSFQQIIPPSAHLCSRQWVRMYILLWEHLGREYFIHPTLLWGHRDIPPWIHLCIPPWGHPCKPHLEHRHISLLKHPCILLQGHRCKYPLECLRRPHEELSPQ